MPKKTPSITTTEPTSAAAVSVPTPALSSDEAVATPPTTPTIPMTSVIDFTAIPIVRPPPTVSIPEVPVGFEPVPAIDLRGYRPITSELSSVPDAVAEIRRFADWELVFGMTAPPPSQVAQRLEVAAQWSEIYARSEAWFNYVKSETGSAWKLGLEVMGALKAPFQHASSVRPSIPPAFPALTRLLTAKQVVAKRGASTKRRKALEEAATKAAAAAAENANVASSVSAASTTTATPGVDPAGASAQAGS